MAQKERKKERNCFGPSLFRAGQDPDRGGGCLWRESAFSRYHRGYDSRHGGNKGGKERGTKGLLKEIRRSSRGLTVGRVKRKKSRMADGYAKCSAMLALDDGHEPGNVLCLVQSHWSANVTDRRTCCLCRVGHLEIIRINK